MKFSKYFLILAFVFLALSFFAAKRISRPTIFISKQDSTINFNSRLTEYFHMGQKRLISSAMWIATIIESDIDHYKMKDMNSWMFLRFKTISDLEPRFYENYQYGSVYLSIVKDDLPGASYIYERGLKEYPDDYFLLKNAAFHYEFEVGDQKSSYEIYSKLKVHPKIDLVTLGIAARLETQFGDKKAAFELLREQYEKIPDKSSFLSTKLFQNLYSLKAEIDLECLNTRAMNCSGLDLENVAYKFEGNKYVAQKKWIPFRLYHRAKK